MSIFRRLTQKTPATGTSTDQEIEDLATTPSEPAAIQDEMKTPTLLQVRDLSVEFPLEDKVVKAVRYVSFDLDRGRLDRSAHPYTTSFAPSDVRLTTRVFRDTFTSALFSSIHEAGHGTYEQGFDPRFDRTPLSNSASLSVHESQSRMWENVLYLFIRQSRQIVQMPERML